MKKLALMVITFTILSKVLGFAREMVLAFYYGTSYITDAYVIALTIPTVIFTFIGSAISTAYVPLYTKIENNDSENQANNYTNNIVNILMVICSIIVIIVIIFTEYVIKLFASGFEGYVLDLAVVFTRITIIGIYFTTLIQLFSAFLQIKDNYKIPALLGIPMNICLIVFIVISAKYSIEFMALGVVVSLVVQWFFLVPFIIEKGYRHKITINLKDTNVQNMLVLTAPVILGVAVNDINKIVDRTMASRIAEGGIATLNYAQTINNLVQGVIVVSIATIIYPLISKLAVSEDMHKFKKVLKQAINSINLLVIPCTIGTMIFCYEIIELLFGRGAFDEYAIYTTGSALFFYAIGMLGVGLRYIISRFFFSIEDTKTPIVNACIGLVINIILNVILSKFMGIKGLALATSISAIIVLFLMLISLRKKIGPFGMREIIFSFFKILAAATTMGILTKASYLYLNRLLSQNISLLIAIFVGSLLYAVIIYFMKIEDVDLFYETLRNKFSK